MIVYKAFRKGMKCRSHQFVMGINVTDKANCAQNGFHAVEEPFNMFRYYHYEPGTTDEYYICDAGGDIDEDDTDSKISCTKLTIIRRLTIEELTAAELLYIKKNPERHLTQYLPYITVLSDKASAVAGGAAIAIGSSPVAKGMTGSVLGLVQKNNDDIRMRMYMVDGSRIKPDTWYGMEGEAYEG